MADSEEGRELHREFVGMLFALAIGQVATDAAVVASGTVTAPNSLPTYSHLILAAIVIAASWVGWGQSDHSLSDINSIFSFDFIELAVDLWLVVLYFFLVNGTELPQAIPGSNASFVKPDAASECKWIFAIFISYLIWDVISKITPPKPKKRTKQSATKSKSTYSWFPRNEKGNSVVIQRGWASILCTCLAYLAYVSSTRVGTDIARVLLADLALLSLVFLFRALKLADLYDFFASARSLVWSAIFLISFFVCLIGATTFTGIGEAISTAASTLIHGIFGATMLQ